MFIRVDKKYLEEYAKNDYLLKLIKNNAKLVHPKIRNSRQFKNMIKHQWKRAIFNTLYYDLNMKKIADIGGAYAGYKPLIDNNFYTLIEPEKRFGLLENVNVIQAPFQQYSLENEYYDYVICCDVYFSDGKNFNILLDRYLPICKELRMTLTFRFDKSDVYRKGVTLKWINDTLKQYGVYDEVYYEKENLLPNNRNVYLVSFKGYAKDYN